MSTAPKNSGTVKFYNQNKGFGFIYVEREKRDIYFHITSVKGANPPKVADQVLFDIREVKGRSVALEIEIKHLPPTRVPRKSLRGFPCTRGDSIDGFQIDRIIKKIETSGYKTVDDAKDDLIAKAKSLGANAIVNYIWHRESDWSDDYLIFWKISRTRKTTFWAEGKAVRLI